MPGESMNRWSCASTTPSRSTGTGPVTLTTWLPATGTSCCTWTPGHRTGAGGSHTARASGIVDADTTGGPDAQPRDVPRTRRGAHRARAHRPVELRGLRREDDHGLHARG